MFTTILKVVFLIIEIAFVVATIIEVIKNLKK